MTKIFSIDPAKFKKITFDNLKLISNGHNARPILVPILRDWLNDFKGETDLSWDFKEKNNSLCLYQNLSSPTKYYTFHATENPDTIEIHHEYFYAEIGLQQIDFYAVGVPKMEEYVKRFKTSKHSKV